MKHIRIISPSGAIDPAYIDRAAARLRSWGHEVSEGLFARGTNGRFAGTDEERLQDLTEALADPSVDCILCSRGGYGLQRIIDRVPAGYDKPVIGFSDITALHCLWAQQNSPSLHSIMCKHVATLPEDSDPMVYLRKALDGEPLFYTVPAHPLNRQGNATAPVKGGNLSVLYGLQGTPYALQNTTEGSILLIEDICERHYHIDRMMRNLRMSGLLASLSGLVVGQFSDCDDDPGMKCTVYETIKEAVADYDYPVVFNAPFGHVAYNLPLWLGRPVSLSVTSEGATIR